MKSVNQVKNNCDSRAGVVIGECCTCLPFFCFHRISSSGLRQRAGQLYALTLARPFAQREEHVPAVALRMSVRVDAHIFESPPQS